MTIRNLDFLFQPRSIVLIGASPREASLGSLVLKNLKVGGFKGWMGWVNPKYKCIGNDPVWHTAASLPMTPDLAIICTPAHTVADLIHQLGVKGCKSAIVISAGMHELSNDGINSYEQSMLNAAQPYLMRILGPNCIGLLIPSMGLNASFAPSNALPGHLAFVSQSGALATAMLDWANSREIGFSYFISLGDSADIDFGDVLDYLASDSNTHAVLMYAESISSARKFMSAARQCARAKPVVIVKAGRAPAGAMAAATHTHAIAGSDIVHDAAFRRAGMLRVDTLEALFDAAQTLAHVRPLMGERIAILTNGGGAGVLAADALQLNGGVLATLSSQTIEALNTCLPPSWSHSNPIDIIGDAPVLRYQESLKILLNVNEVDAVMFIHAPTAIVNSLDIANACLELMKSSHKPILTCWLGEKVVQAARVATTQANLPTYSTPERAVMAWKQMINYAHNQAALQQLPIAIVDDFIPDRFQAQQIFEKAASCKHDWLDGASTMQLLNAYGIPTVKTLPALTLSEAVKAANSIGYPVALKIQSQTIIHKSDIGGVELNLVNDNQVEQALRRISDEITKHRPNNNEYSFVVQSMADYKHSTELILGINNDPLFGPVLMLGEGGTMVELRHNHAVALPPINVNLAIDLIKRSHLGSFLNGYRGKPAANESALISTIIKVSQMATELHWIDELDINPLLIDSNGILAVDARVKLRTPTINDDKRLAIRPYPYELEEKIQISLQTMSMRPIQPQDGPRLVEFYSHATASDMRMRFFYSRKSIPTIEITRYSQIDYDREMTLIVCINDKISEQTIVAEMRSQCDPDNVQAQFSLMIAREWQSKGIGYLLMQKMIAYQRMRKTQELTGQCLRDNTPMINLARSVGFQIKSNDAIEDTVQMYMDL